MDDIVTEQHRQLAEAAIQPEAVHVASAPHEPPKDCGHCRVRDRVARAIAQAEARGTGKPAAHGHTSPKRHGKGT